LDFRRKLGFIGVKFLPIVYVEEYMKHKFLGCMAVLLVLLVFPASASMVSFLIVETGLNEGMQSSLYGSLWEDGLMASFFDAGHIVTNSPILRMEQKPPQDFTGTIKADFDDAVLGGAEYFILCLLDHQVQGRRAVPVNITIRTYRTDTRELIFEQIFPVGRGRSENEELRLAQSAGSILVSRIKDR
jgi:hypothetical protein